MFPGGASLARSVAILPVWPSCAIPQPSLSYPLLPLHPPPSFAESPFSRSFHERAIPSSRPSRLSYFLSLFRYYPIFLSLFSRQFPCCLLVKAIRREHSGERARAMRI